MNRKQLRRMIMSAINEHRLRPDASNIPPQHLDKIHDLIMAGELEMAQSLILWIIHYLEVFGTADC